MVWKKAKNKYLKTISPYYVKVVNGMDVVDSIAKVQTNSNDKPLNEIVIIKTSII